MVNLNGFDANDVEPAVGFDPLPQGTYPAAITGSEFKPTRDAIGHYLELTFQILEGPYEGRMLWARLNLENPKALTVKIARAELSAICRAVGVTAPRDSVELHDLPLLIKVGLKKRKDTGELTNVIKGYEKKSAVAVPVPASANGNGKAPWQR